MAVALVNELVTQQEALDYVMKNPDASARTADELDVLNRIINGVSAAAEKHCGYVFRRRTITGEKHDGGGEWLFLRYRPVVSVTSVTEDGRPLTVDRDLYLYAEDGTLRKASPNLFGSPVTGAEGPTWSTKPQGNVAAYVAGAAESVSDVPWDVKQAALDWIMDTWNTGPANLTNQLSGDTVIRPTRIPPQVVEKLKPYTFKVVG